MKKRFVIIASILLILVLSIALLFGANKEMPVVSAYTGLDYSTITSGINDYETYLEKEEANFPEKLIIIDARNYSEIDNVLNIETVELQTFENEEGLYIPETVDVTWNFNVEESGYYNIKIRYVATEGRSSEISRGIKINGIYPFVEAENFVLSRIWEDEYNVADKRVTGSHDIKPKQIEKIIWNEETVADNVGYYSGKSYYFYFNEGLNEISFIQDREPVLISEITLFQDKADKSYSDVYQNYLDLGYKNISSDIFENGYYEVQGENSFEKSTAILSPTANWSSYKIVPYEKFIMRYNTIGGNIWRIAGDWISWEVEAPESGLYQITFKTSQNYKQNIVSSRILRINGEVPFEEARNVSFNYDSDWQNITLGNEDGAYWFYLEKGTNEISLQATIGIYNNVVKKIEYAISLLNQIYRQVVMIAGTNPDQYQDYMFNQRIPELSNYINNSIDFIETAKAEMQTINKKSSSLIATIDRVLYQLNKFSESEKNIQIGLNELDDNISALGTWVTSISEQPLAVDLLYIHGEDVKLPKATTNFFQKIWHELVMLFGSYGANTSLKSNVEVEGPTITVWIMSGRDQSQLLRQIIDEQFTLQNNINVELKLVTTSALLPATLSGNGPDVAIGVGQNIPVNWGIRNAVVDLTTFPDYEIFSQNFHESAVVPFAFRDSVYALPDTHDFLMTFVRTDIAEELDIKIPESWDEVIDLVPSLQRQYLDYYLPNTKGNLSTLMYAMIAQNGGSLYEEDGKRTLLLEENAMDAFIDFTTFFSDFGFEISANFANRFRSGEMPLGIFNYSLYNTLSVFAPEIKGQWDFAPLPGYDKDGVIHNQSTSTVTGTVILEQSDEKYASWQFLKWWLGEEAQTSYGRGMEAILGSAARYPTANLDAFENLPWSAKDFLILSKQRENTVGVPTVPGDYIIGRYIDNAFRATINDRTNPRDNLYEYATKIDRELERKREEFGLD
ncbi:MAG: extracellular solute-binding protein [Candidatus Izemoplasmatales bacterium]